MWITRFIDWLFGSSPIHVHEDSGISRQEAKYVYGDYIRDTVTGATYTVLSSCVSTSRYKMPTWVKDAGRSYLLANNRYASTLFAFPLDVVESELFEPLELVRRPKIKTEKKDETVA